MSHMNFLESVSADDVRVLKEKERTYQGSWKKRGGVGAFMMLARKWDRIETQAREQGYDIFTLLEESTVDGIADDVGDLRRYLLLVEAEICARRVEKELEK